MRQIYWENATRILRENFNSGKVPTTIRIPESKLLHAGNLSELVAEMSDLSGVERCISTGARRVTEVFARWRAARAVDAPIGGHPNPVGDLIAGWVVSRKLQVRRATIALCHALIICCLVLMTPMIVKMNNAFGISSSWVVVPMLYGFFIVCLGNAIWEARCGRKCRIQQMLGWTTLLVTYFTAVLCVNGKSVIVENFARIWIGALPAIIHIALLVGTIFIVAREVSRRSRVKDMERVAGVLSE